MHETAPNLSRRSFSQLSFGSLAGLIVAPRAFAKEILPTPMALMGPYYPVKRIAEQDADLTRLRGHSKRALGQVIELTGRVLDRQGNPFGGAVMELWQANAAGRYAHANDPGTSPLDPNFQGFAALRVGADGHYRITTIKPPPYPARTLRPSHIHFDVRGRNARLVTQMFFPGEDEIKRNDRTFQQMASDGGNATARLIDGDANRYAFDIVLNDI